LPGTALATSVKRQFRGSYRSSSRMTPQRPVSQGREEVGGASEAAPVASTTTEVPAPAAGMDRSVGEWGHA
jgi:hypothetical protein